MQWTKVRRNSERGASLVEYALLIGLIALVCFGAIGVLGSSVSDVYQDFGGSLN